jgi:protein-S-isoprenylcysteine O-methyltransferase Ste14
MGLGWTGYWLSVVSGIALVMLVIVLTKKAQFEERRLIEPYGRAYEHYMSNVDRFVPKIGSRRQSPS